MFEINNLFSKPSFPELGGVHVAVLGLARSGIAVSQLLRRHGAQVLVSEAKTNAALEAQAQDFRALGIEVETGGHTRKILESDLLVRSPGVPNSNPWLSEARQKRISVVSEIEAAAWYCRAPIAAVTGSNGKTTTTEWLGDVFHRSGRPTVVCGNVGRPFSAVVESLPPEGIAVVEVSSFQLEDTVSFAPQAAIITNFSPDHLDRYAAYDDYLAAKCRIFSKMSNQAAVIYNRGDAELGRRVAGAKARLLSFGLEADFQAGAGILDQEIVVRQKGITKKLLSQHSIALPGNHNLENALAVICAALDLGAPEEALVASLQCFKGVPHRLEKVLESAGILWINDSKATNIASGLVALQSFTRPLILLVGGRNKGSDFDAVADAVRQRVRQVIFFGEAGPVIQKAWSKAFTSASEWHRVASLEEAVKIAKDSAQAGEVVLLSPMCASFDEFQNYEDRGEQFKTWVRLYAENKS